MGATDNGKVFMKAHEIGNPSSMSPKEAVLFDEIKVRVHRLLDELKKNNKLQKPTKEQLGAFLNVVERVNRHAHTVNVIIDIFKYGKSEKFVKHNKAFGFEKLNFPELYFYLNIQHFNMQTELLRLGFLTVIKKKKTGIINLRSINCLTG